MLELTSSGGAAAIQSCGERTGACAGRGARAQREAPMQRNPKARRARAGAQARGRRGWRSGLRRARRACIHLAVWEGSSLVKAVRMDCCGGCATAGAAVASVRASAAAPGAAAPRRAAAAAARVAACRMAAQEGVRSAACGRVPRGSRVAREAPLLRGARTPLHARAAHTPQLALRPPPHGRRAAPPVAAALPPAAGAAEMSDAAARSGGAGGSAGPAAQKRDLSYHYWHGKGGGDAPPAQPQARGAGAARGRGCGVASTSER